MSLPPLILRADGDARTGMGHLMRSLALAQAWEQRGGRTVLVTRSDEPDARFSEVRWIDAGEADAAFTARVSHQEKARWIVADGYQFDAAWCAGARQYGSKLLAVEDFPRGLEAQVDAILNPNPYAAPADYLGRSAHLLGAAYLGLRSEFLKYSGLDRVLAEKPRKLLVTMGGGDADNVTSQVLRDLTARGEDWEIVAVLGPANPHFDAVSQFNNVQIERSVDDMAQLMAWADLAVSAGGGSTWELAFMGCPALLVVIADNQIAVVDEAVNRGTAQRWQPGAELPDLAARQLMAQNGRALIDGRGMERICAFLEREEI